MFLLFIFVEVDIEISIMRLTNQWNVSEPLKKRAIPVIKAPFIGGLRGLIRVSLDVLADIGYFHNIHFAV